MMDSSQNQPVSMNHETAKGATNLSPPRAQTSSQHPSPPAETGQKSKDPDTQRSSKRYRRTKAELFKEVPDRRTSARIAIMRRANTPSAGSQPKPAEKRKAPGRPKKGSTEVSKVLTSYQSDEWEVERIVRSLICANTHEHLYEVKWKGFPNKDNTWEPKVNLRKCRIAIAEFERRTEQK